MIWLCINAESNIRENIYISALRSFQMFTGPLFQKDYIY